LGEEAERRERKRRTMLARETFLKPMVSLGSYKKGDRRKKKNEQCKTAMLDDL